MSSIRVLMNQDDLLISKTPRKKGSLMIFANGGVQDYGYERKCEKVVRSQNQWDFQIHPSNDRAMFSSQTEAQNGGNYF